MIKPAFSVFMMALLFWLPHKIISIAKDMSLDPALGEGPAMTVLAFGVIFWSAIALGWRDTPR